MQLIVVLAFGCSIFLYLRRYYFQYVSVAKSIEQKLHLCFLYNLSFRVVPLPTRCQVRIILDILQRMLQT